jgi:hypothetical protein
LQCFDFGTASFQFIALNTSGLFLSLEPFGYTNSPNFCPRTPPPPEIPKKPQSSRSSHSPLKSPMKRPPLESSITIETTQGPSVKESKMSEESEIISALFLNSVQVAAVKKDPSNILVVADNITSYRRNMQTLSDLCTELENSQKDNSYYAKRIGDLERDLDTANGTIRLLQKLATHTLTLRTIELPHPPEFSGDCKKLPNFIAKVRSKLAGENARFTDDQHKLRYVYGYLKGNAQN